MSTLVSVFSRLREREQVSGGWRERREDIVAKVCLAPPSPSQGARAGMWPERPGGGGMLQPAGRGTPKDLSGHPRALRALQQVPLQHQGPKARRAPPPLDGSETPRSRYSECRNLGKRQKEYGGGALILARRPSCAKQGARPSVSPGQPFTRHCGPSALE